MVLSDNGSHLRQKESPRNRRLVDMSRRLVAILSVVFLLAASSVVVVFANHSNTGIVEPLYSYPSEGTWNPVKVAKGNFPNVPLAVIVNPADGPGTCCDKNYQAGISQLRSVGVIVLDRKSTRLNSSHDQISYAVFCL